MGIEFQFCEMRSPGDGGPALCTDILHCVPQSGQGGIFYVMRILLHYKQQIKSPMAEPQKKGKTYTCHFLKGMTKL